MSKPALTVRHSEPRGIPSIRAIYAEPSVQAATLQLPYPSLELWENRLLTPNLNFHSLVAVDDDRILGHLGVHIFESPRRRHAANIGLGVSESARRRGVASALMDAAIDLCEKWAGIRRLELETYTDNEPAIALFKSKGFVVKGAARGYALRNGQYVDAFLMVRHAA